MMESGVNVLASAPDTVCEVRDDIEDVLSPLTAKQKLTDATAAMA